MKIKQAINFMQKLLEEMGDVEMAVVLPSSDGTSRFESFEFKSIAGIGLPDEDGNSIPTVAIFDPQLDHDLKLELMTAHQDIE